MSGTLYGIGVGPGDPELLTLKAARLIAACPVISYPMANGEPSLARRIAAAHIQLGVLERPYSLPMATDPAAAQAAYDDLARSLQADLSDGRDVAVLCEGDPLFYGSFAEVMRRLDDRTPIEIVPGIPSAHAAAAALKRPLVQRTASWAVPPATLSDRDLLVRLRTADAAAILKLGRHLGRVRALLKSLNLASRATYCERVGQAGERFLPLAEMNDTTAPYFSLILVHMQAKLPPLSFKPIAARRLAAG